MKRFHSINTFAVVMYSADLLVATVMDVPIAQARDLINKGDVIYSQETIAHHSVMLTVRTFKQILTIESDGQDARTWTVQFSRDTRTIDVQEY